MSKKSLKQESIENILIRIRLLQHRNIALTPTKAETFFPLVDSMFHVVFYNHLYFQQKKKQNFSVKKNLLMMMLKNLS